MKNKKNKVKESDKFRLPAELRAKIYTRNGCTLKEHDVRYLDVCGHKMITSHKIIDRF